MENIIIIAVIALIVAFAVGYIYKEKKKGIKCIGCPYAAECASKNSSYECSCGRDSLSVNE